MFEERLFFLKEKVMRVEAYLNFDGRCEEAIEFYKKSVGAQVTTIMKYKDAPPEACGGQKVPADRANKVMHSSFKIGETTVMASDGECKGEAKFQGISLSL